MSRPEGRRTPPTDAFDPVGRTDPTPPQDERVDVDGIDRYCTSIEAAARGAHDLQCLQRRSVDHDGHTVTTVETPLSGIVHLERRRVEAGEIIVWLDESDGLYHDTGGTSGSPTLSPMGIEHLWSRALAVLDSER